MSAPIRLSDEALTALLQLAQPLPVADRSEFLQQVADRLSREPMLGDGVVFRVGRQVQSELLAPPDTWTSHLPRPRGRPRKAQIAAIG